MTACASCGFEQVLSGEATVSGSSHSCIVNHIAMLEAQLVLTHSSSA